jgi:hypothetical protein
VTVIFIKTQKITLLKEKNFLYEILSESSSVR